MLVNSQAAGRASMAASPVDFSRIPMLKEVKVDFYAKTYITEFSVGEIRMYLLEDLLSIFGIPQRINDPISIKTLDLGRISMVLLPDPPQVHDPDYDIEVDRYSTRLDNTPLGIDIALWQTLDAALCSPRFANLETLRVDYIIFNNHNVNSAVPEGYEERVEAVVAPCDWLSLTTQIFPLTVAADRVRLEGRILEIMPQWWAYKTVIDYSAGVCISQYP